MFKTLFLLFLTIIISNSIFSQKKRWTNFSGYAAKKCDATLYYTRKKVKGTNYFLVKRYEKFNDKLYEETVYKSKQLIIKQGLFKEFHTNGKIKLEGNYNNDLKTGLWKTYNLAYNLISTYNYKNNLLEGDSFNYYPNGKIKTEGTYIKNEKVGTWKKYNEKGELKSISNYLKNKLNGEFINYSKEGIKESGTYKEGKKELIWSYNDNNNRLIKTITYVNNQKEGKAVYYYTNGNIKESTLYKADIIIEQKSYNEEGEELKNVVDDAIYLIIDNPPEFIGGAAAMMQFLAKNTHYPEQAIDNNIQGRAYISFIVEKDGNITDVQSATPQGRDVHKLLLKEAIRVVKSMPKWNPGIHKDKKVRVKYTVPINFRIR